MELSRVQIGVLKTLSEGAELVLWKACWGNGYTDKVSLETKSTRENIRITTFTALLAHELITLVSSKENFKNYTISEKGKTLI